jgi:hypothetical protein
MLRSRKISLIAIFALCCLIFSACAPNGRPFSELEVPEVIIVMGAKAKEGKNYKITNGEKIKEFVDMLNNCTYEKFDDDEDTDTVFKQFKHLRVTIGDQVFYIYADLAEMYINPLVNSGREGRYKIVDFNKDIFDALLDAAENKPADTQ